MAQKAKDADERRVISRNRKATHDFEILDVVEAGLVLQGTEVKSLRAGKANLEGSFARIEGDEVWLYRSEIPEYAMGNRMNHEPKRKRKLLMHRSEIAKLAASVSQKGCTLIPLQLYFKGARAKLEVALARGKKSHDKRETLKTKDAKREMDRATRKRVI